MTPKEFRKSGTHAQQHEWTYYPDKFAEDFAKQELDWYIDTCKKQLDESKQLKKDLAYEIKMREGCIKERVVLNKQVEELRELLQYVANNHLCGTWLLDEMKKHGIEYQEQALNK